MVQYGWGQVFTIEQIFYKISSEKKRRPYGLRLDDVTLVYMVSQVLILVIVVVPSNITIVTVLLLLAVMVM